MAEFRWIKTSLFLILVLQFTAAATGQLFLPVNVRVGDEATLPCNSVMDDHENCDSTEWTFYCLSKPPVVLVRDGQIVEEAKAKSDRLSVSEKCSLVIKNVTDEDGGFYDCSQLISGQQQGETAVVRLSVVTMTEHEDNDEVTLRCSVSTYDRCEHTVKWLLQGEDVEKDNKEFNTSQSLCSSSLTFLTSNNIYTSRFNSFKCEVTDGAKVQQFSFRNSPSGEKTGEDTITTTTEDDTKAANTTTTPAISDASPKLQSWWRFISVSVGLAALIIIVVDKN